MATLEKLFDTKDKIPKIIHQIWLDKGRSLDNDLPKKFKTEQFSHSFKRHNPGYEYRVWNFRAILKLFNDFPQLERFRYFFFNDLKFFIEICDYAKIMIMWCIGGTLFDLDTHCKRNIDPLVNGRFVTLCVDYIHQYNLSLRAFADEPAVFNGFICSAPGHRFWEEFLLYITHTYKGEGRILDSTGPIALGRFMTRVGIYDEGADSQIFVDRCLVIPSPVNHQKVRNGVAEPVCDPEHSIVEVIFSSGISWQVAAAPHYLTFAVEKNHVYLLGILLLIGFVVIIFWLGSRKRELVLMEDRLQKQL